MASRASNMSQSSDVLQDLLHLVSQPLTTLYCALESALERDKVEDLEDVFLALEQTDRVIEAVRLMREYLEAEQGSSSTRPIPLSSAIEEVLVPLSALAEARGLRLFVYGASKAVVSVRDAWLQRALLYLVGALVESEPPGRAIILLLEDAASQSVLSGHGLPISPSLDRASQCAPVSNTLSQAKIAIALRALESLGASVNLYSDGKLGFAIRIPRCRSALDERSA